MSDIPFDRFAFLDFEASSLDANSWPIEVGLSWVTADFEVKTYESLIRPSPDWFEDAWSPINADIHNILRRDLDTTPSVEVISRELLTGLGDRVALSDAPGFERFWLEQLLEAAQLPLRCSIRFAAAQQDITLRAFAAKIWHFRNGLILLKNSDIACLDKI